jgi:hypothetical protein
MVIPQRLRVLVAAVVGTAVSLTGCSGGSSTDSSPRAGGSTPSHLLPSTVPSEYANLPPCNNPTPISFPTWVPKDLPLPSGTYASEELPPSFGYHRGIFVVPGTLTDLARFILREWPRAGWTLGRGDSESSEIEDQFFKTPAVGAFKAQVVYCKPPYALMLLLFAPDRAAVGVPGTQGGSPITPSASPSGSPGPSPSP